MKEIVINSCYGGFDLSYKGVMKYAELKGIKIYGWIDDTAKRIWKEVGKTLTVNSSDAPLIHYCTKPVKNEADYKELKDDKCYWNANNIQRDDFALIKTVKELGKKASGKCADLRIVKIPDDIEWEIQEYDGYEHIAEKHRTWCQ